MRADPRAGFADVEPDALLAVLRKQSGIESLAFAELPVPIGQGGEARVDAFRLAEAPPAFSGPLVLRRLTRDCDPQQVVFERAVHAALAAQGFPVPRVLLADPDREALGFPYLVSERLPGEVLLEEVQQPDQLLAHPTRLPRLFADALFRVPRILAEVQSRLHGLDPIELRDALEAAGIDPARFDYPARVEVLAERIEKHALEGLRPGLDWVRQNEPAGGTQAVCHGDLVFTNLCVQHGEVCGVFDWSTAILADPAYDVAGTLIRLESRIPGVPTLLRPLFQLVQRRLANAYRRGYRQRRPLDLCRVRYYDAFWTLSELSWSSAYLREGAEPTTRIEGRWLHEETIDFGVARFHAATGLTLAPLRPPPAAVTAASR